MAEETKRWRAEEGHEFYFIKITHEGVGICATWEESFDDYCQLMYNFGNYFCTKEEAQTAADEMRKVLLRHAGELHDLQWAISEMKKGNKVRCWRWGVLCYLEIKHLYEGSNSYEIFDQKGNYYELSLSDLEATDWEIYGEEK